MGVKPISGSSSWLSSTDASWRFKTGHGAGVALRMRPSIYQQVGTSRQETAGGYVVDAQRRVHFELTPYDRRSPLVIDPLVYSTYLGGSVPDDGEGIYGNGIGEAIATPPDIGGEDQR